MREREVASYMLDEVEVFCLPLHPRIRSWGMCHQSCRGRYDTSITVSGGRLHMLDVMPRDVMFWSLLSPSKAGQGGVRRTATFME